MLLITKTQCIFNLKENGSSAANFRRLAALQNSSGQAYKPKVAVAQHQQHQKEKSQTLEFIDQGNQHKSHTSSSISSSKLNGSEAFQHVTSDKKGVTGFIFGLNTSFKTFKNGFFHFLSFKG